MLKMILIIIVSGYFFINPVFASDCSPQQTINYQEYVKALRDERATAYNALNLSDEQIKMYEDMIAENAPCYENDFRELVRECYRLKAMEEAKSSSCDIYHQRRVVKQLRKKLEKSFDKDTKAFKKCLTYQQRAKYSMIKKLERDDFKKASRKKKDYYKANPQMARFGNPKPQQCCK